MIVETTDNRLYSVRDSGNPNLAHCYLGVPVKRVGVGYVPRAKAREQLVSKAHVFRVAEGETAQ